MHIIPLAGFAIGMVLWWGRRRTQRTRLAPHPGLLAAVSVVLFLLAVALSSLLLTWWPLVNHPGTYCWPIVLLPLVGGITYKLAAELPLTLVREGFCQCGYDLTGNVSGVCPECGQPINK